MSDGLYLGRRLRNGLAIALATAATALGLFFLGWILLTTIGRGLTAFDLALFTEMTPPPGADGGMANALFGSVVMSLLAILIGAPVGIAAGTFLAEYARGRWFGETVRFVNDILLSAPSIVIGLFVYALLVQHTRFSAIAGALALAFIVIPIVVRTTDEMLRLVPVQMREAALSLGIPQWKLTLQVLYRAAAPGILTGVLLALARISGETAPLLFTAFSNQFWSSDLSSAMANVPVVVFQYAMSPFPAWQALAWSGALVITLFVLLLSLAARAFLLRKSFRND
jgi:phosphate transport system permease protein